MVSLQKGVSLGKGEGISLTKSDPTLHKVTVGLGWDAPEEVEGESFDVDASAFLLNKDGRIRRDTDFVFYNNLETEQGAVKHMGDNLVGSADGDNADAEVVVVNLDKVPFDIEKVAFGVSIHNATERNQTFGKVSNAYIRVANAETNQELARFDLTEDASSNNAMVFGELMRDGLGWKFSAIGSGHNGGLFKLARDFGVNVAGN